MYLPPPSGYPDPIDDVGAVAALAMDLVNEAHRARVPLRVGMHTGSQVAGGIIGATRPRYIIAGPDFDAAVRIEGSSPVGCISVSRATAARLVRQGFKLVQSTHFEGESGDDERVDAEDDTTEPGSRPGRLPTFILTGFTGKDGQRFFSDGQEFELAAEGERVP